MVNNFSLQTEGSTTPTNASDASDAFEEPQASKIFRIVFFSLTTLASLLGNTVMCKAACEFPSRKPLSYHLVTNLAVAEIINTLCFPIIFVYYYLGTWPFGEFVCKLTFPLQVLSMFVVTSTLAAIAVHRVVFFVFQRRIDTYPRIILLLCLLWVVALAVSIPLAVFYKVKTSPENKIYCDAEFEGDDLDNWHTPNQNKYEIIRFILNFGVPYLIMLVSYGAVAYKLRGHISRTNAELAEMSELGQSVLQSKEEIEEPQRGKTEATPREARRKSTRRITELEHDLLKMIYAVIIVFIVCYLPYQVVFFLSFFEWFEHHAEAKKYKDLVGNYSFLLTILSSALHPLCYGTMSKFYALSFSRLVLCKPE